MMISAAFLVLAWTAAATAASKLTVLQDLTQQTGGSPEFPPIIGQDGALYGTTYTANGGGGIYALGTNGKNFAGLYEFPGGAAGSGPFGGLVQGQDGLFYGTTLFAGTSGQGTVFQFNAATRTATILHAFDVADGATPYAGSSRMPTAISMAQPRPVAPIVSARSAVRYSRCTKRRPDLRSRQDILWRSAQRWAGPIGRRCDLQIF